MAGHEWRIVTPVLLIQAESTGFTDILAIEAVGTSVGLLINQVSVTFEEGASSGQARVDICIANDDGTGGVAVAPTTVGGDTETFTLTAHRHANTGGPPPTSDGWTGANPAGAKLLWSKYWSIVATSPLNFDFHGPNLKIKAGDALLVRIAAPHGVTDASAIVTVIGEE